MSIKGLLSYLFFTIISLIGSIPLTLRLVWMANKLVCIHYAFYLLATISIVALQIYLHRFEFAYMLLLVFNYLFIWRKTYPIVASCHMLFLIKHFSYPGNPHELGAVSDILSKIESMDLNPKTKLALSKEFIPYVVEASA